MADKSFYTLIFGLLISFSKFGSSNSNGFTKLAYVQTDSFDQLLEIGVIDLESPDNWECQNLPTPQNHLRKTKGFFVQDKLILCGKSDANGSDCNSLEQGSWIPIDNFGSFRNKTEMGWYDFSITPSPFPDDGSKLFLTSGTSTHTEVLTPSGWQFSTPMPVEVYKHCMVQLNDTAVMAIGGTNSDTLKTSGQTFIFNSDTSLWTEGPSLQYPRENPLCAVINKDGQGSDKSIIVIGGTDIKNKEVHALLSSEVLDLGSSEWRKGPELPFHIEFGAIVEDSSGGIAIVGGYSGSFNSFSLVRLADVEDSWRDVTHRGSSKFVTYVSSAFLISDEVANCQRI